MSQRLNRQYVWVDREKFAQNTSNNKFGSTSIITKLPAPFQVQAPVMVLQLQAFSQHH